MTICEWAIFLLQKWGFIANCILIVNKWNCICWKTHHTCKTCWHYGESSFPTLDATSFMQLIFLNCMCWLQFIYSHKLQYKIHIFVVMIYGIFNIIKLIFVLNYTNLWFELVNQNKIWNGI